MSHEKKSDYHYSNKVEGNLHIVLNENRLFFITNCSFYHMHKTFKVASNMCGQHIQEVSL